MQHDYMHVNCRYNGKKIIQSHKTFLGFSFSKVYDKDATSASSFTVEAYFKHGMDEIFKSLLMSLNKLI